MGSSQTQCSHEGEASGSCGGGGSCGGDGGCGRGASAAPEFDARLVDPRVRQSAIFGVLMGLAPGTAVTIVADQDPQPLVAFLGEQLPDQYVVGLQDRGALAWAVTFTRNAEVTAVG